MKYMLIMRATDEAYAAMADVDMDEMIELVGRFQDELRRAGVLLAAEGLEDPAETVVVDHGSEPPVVTDGPYGRPRRCVILGPGGSAARRRSPVIREPMRSMSISSVTGHAP